MNGIPCPNGGRWRAEVTFVKNPRLENRKWQDQGFVKYRALTLPEKNRYFLPLFVATPLLLYVVGRVAYVSSSEPTGRNVMFVR
jgi:hypothetical protein